MSPKYQFCERSRYCREMQSPKEGIGEEILLLARSKCCKAVQSEKKSLCPVTLLPLSTSFCNPPQPRVMIHGRKSDPESLLYDRSRSLRLSVQGECCCCCWFGGYSRRLPERLRDWRLWHEEKEDKTETEPERALWERSSVVNEVGQLEREAMGPVRLVDWRVRI